MNDYINIKQWDVITNPCHNFICAVVVRIWMSNYIAHYSDVIMGTMASQITSLTTVYSSVIQAQIKENIQGRIQDLKLGVAQMDGKGGYFYLFSYIKCIYFIQGQPFSYTVL